MKFLKGIFLCIALLGFAILMSCKKNPPTVPTPENIIDTPNSNSLYKSFNSVRLYRINDSQLFVGDDIYIDISGHQYVGDIFCGDHRIPTSIRNGFSPYTGDYYYGGLDSGFMTIPTVWRISGSENCTAFQFTDTLPFLPVDIPDTIQRLNGLHFSFPGAQSGRIQFFTTAEYYWHTGLWEKSFSGTEVDITPQELSALPNAIFLSAYASTEYHYDSSLYVYKATACQKWVILQ